MSQSLPPAPTPDECPLCGQANQCAIAAGLAAEHCWCMQTSIAPEALARVPAAERGKRCICAACGRPVTSPSARI